MFSLFKFSILSLTLLAEKVSLTGSLSPSNLLSTISDRSFLVVGGTGRVGGSVARSLSNNGAKRVAVGGRGGGDTTQGDYGRDYIVVDKDNAESLVGLDLSSFDLVVNTAGPFQGKSKDSNLLMEKCLSSKVPYIDVCDDFETAKRAKRDFSEQAVAANVPMIISTGCWPGVSSLMSKALLHELGEETDPSRISCKFQFFTAGSGNAGVTLLVATFLILAERALKVVDGVKMYEKPMDVYETVDFGPEVGAKYVAPLNLLETASIAETLKIGSVESLFGTSPNFWNSLLGFSAKFPTSLLSNEPLMRALSSFSMPIVRVVDKFAGAKNAMRVDLTTQDNRMVSATYAHIDLEPCVGECVAAFAAATLSKEVGVRPGVWFTEGEDRQRSTLCSEDV